MRTVWLRWTKTDVDSSSRPLGPARLLFFWCRRNKITGSRTPSFVLQSSGGWAAGSRLRPALTPRVTVQFVSKDGVVCGHPPIR